MTLSTSMSCSGVDDECLTDVDLLTRVMMTTQRLPLHSPQKLHSTWHQSPARLVWSRCGCPAEQRQVPLGRQSNAAVRQRREASISCEDGQSVGRTSQRNALPRNEDAGPCVKMDCQRNGVKDDNDDAGSK